MNVLFFWEPVGGLTLKHPCNPYAGLLGNALAAHDVTLELGDYAFESAWLEEKRRSFDAIHLHWLHYFYRGGTREKSGAKLKAFIGNLEASREMGYRIVWTLHNLYPHERPFPDLDHAARVAVTGLAHEMIAHCGFAADRARRLFGRTDAIHTIPHGHFIDIFPNTLTREQARAGLGLPPDAFVYLFFGNARTYKGVEQLQAAFRQISGPDDRLLIMMRNAFDPAYGDRLLRDAEGDERIQIHTSEWFDNADFQKFLNAADAAVFPFADVLTSGSVITALSFGLPVVVPARGCLPELVSPPAGILYDPGRGDGLSSGLLEIRGSDLVAGRKAALNRARSLDWASIAEQTAALYAGSQHVAPFSSLA